MSVLEWRGVGSQCVPLSYMAKDHLVKTNHGTDNHGMDASVFSASAFSLFRGRCVTVNFLRALSDENALRRSSFRYGPTGPSVVGPWGQNGLIRVTYAAGCRCGEYASRRRHGLCSARTASCRGEVLISSAWSFCQAGHTSMAGTCNGRVENTVLPGKLYAVGGLRRQRHALPQNGRDRRIITVRARPWTFILRRRGVVRPLLAYTMTHSSFRPVVLLWRGHEGRRVI
jgi:hypothetical protein